MFLDLEELNLYSLDANQGIGRLVIRLPKAAAEEVLINQAIGTIHIQIPDNVKVTVDAQNGLSRVEFPADFELRNGLYSSPGANRTNSELNITVEQAIGYIIFQYAR
jgi:predicted membrane protein